jgi:hypothetical protein
VEERGRDETTGRKGGSGLASFQDAPDATTSALEIPKGSLGRLLVAGTDFSTDVGRPKGVQHAHRLRSRVSAVVGDHSDLGVARGEHFT